MQRAAGRTSGPPLLIFTSHGPKNQRRFPMPELWRSGRVTGQWHRSVLLGMVGGLLAGGLEAQRRGSLDAPRVGPHLGYNFDADALVIGVQASLPLTARLDLYPSLDYYSVRPGTLWAINLDMKFRPPTRTGAFYVGGGIDYLHTSANGGSGDVNLNFIGGLEARRQSLSPFAEGRLILGSGSTFQIVGGFNVKLR